MNLRESHMMRDRALGVYEYWKTQLVMDVVKPGMTVVDVGVNKGYFSLLFAKLMNDYGKVLSFEPDPTNCYWIRKSIEANNYKSIKLFQLALSDNDGTASFYPGKKSGWGSLFFSPYGSTPTQKPIIVKTRKLDDLLNEQRIDSIDIIKIDVEGADLMVLKGAHSTLERCKHVIMDIDVKSEEAKKQIFNILSSYGFRIYRIGRKLTFINETAELGEGKDIYATKVE